MMDATGQRPDLKDAYRRNGFVFPIDVMTEGEALQYRRQFEAMETRARQMSLPRPLNDYLRYNTHLVSTLAYRLATMPVVLDHVEQILGPDLLLWATEIIVKEPGTEKFLSWHQDLTYWGFGETTEQVTAWIALSPATNASGCMRFMPGSHTQQVPHNDTYGESNILSRGQEVAVEVDESQAASVELRPGQMSLHHGLMFHSSGPNRSDDRRIGVVIRYMAPGVKQQVAASDYAMMVRGMDRQRNFVHLAPPAGDFSELGLALFEEVAAEQAKPLGAGATREMSYDRMG